MESSFWRKNASKQFQLVVDPGFVQDEHETWNCTEIKTFAPNSGFDKNKENL